MAEPNPICAHCADNIIKWSCKGCSAIKYCSPECQQADWQWHKHLCKEYAAFKTKPDVNSRLAIYLPPEGTKPRFVWVQVNPSDPDSDDEVDPSEVQHDKDLNVPVDDTTPGYALSDFKGLFGDNRPRTTLLVLGTTACGEHLDHSIHIAHLDTSIPFPPSACLAHLISPLTPYFKGPLVLHAMTKASRSKHILDLHVSDFSLALKGLIEHIAKVSPGTNTASHSVRSKAKGVKLSTEGTFEAVEIPFLHPIFKGKGHVSAISKASLRTPILTWQANTKNPPSIHLNMNISTPSANEPAFGSLPPDPGDGKKKDILIAQKDQDWLPPLGARLMCNFCRDEVAPLMQRLLSEDSRPLFPAELVKEMWMGVLQDTLEEHGYELWF